MTGEAFAATHVYVNNPSSTSINHQDCLFVLTALEFQVYCEPDMPPCHSYVEILFPI